MVTAHGNGLSIPKSRKFKYGPTSLSFLDLKEFTAVPCADIIAIFFTTVFVSGFVRRHFPFVWEKEYFG
jgi:hypothetical protein